MVVVGQKKAVRVMEIGKRSGCSRQETKSVAVTHCGSSLCEGENVVVSRANGNFEHERKDKSGECSHIHTLLSTPSVSLCFVRRTEDRIGRESEKKCMKGRGEDEEDS